MPLMPKIVWQIKQLQHLFGEILIKITKKNCGAKLSVLYCWCQIVWVPNSPVLLCWCQNVRILETGACRKYLQLNGAKLKASQLQYRNC